MTVQAQPVPALAALGNVHHAAYRCRDAAQTRWFYEELLGLPLRAALVFDRISGTEAQRDYMHLFFELGDGSFIAFFDEPDRATPESFARKDGFDLHLALETGSEEAMLAWQSRIIAAGKTCLGPVDHGFVKSVYLYDPNGIQVEITCRAPRHAEILAEEQAQVEQTLREWTARTRAQKERVFGAAALDKR